MRTALFWAVVQGIGVIPYHVSGQPIHLQGSRILGFVTLDDGNDRLSRNVGNNYNYSLLNDPKEGSSLLLCGGSLKSGR